jgi:hypothetical protein
MPHINRTRRNPAVAAVAALALLLACLGLAACGGSSSTSSTSASAAATSSTASGSATGPSGAGAGRFTALRECLQKNGITLPKRTPGQRPPAGAGGFFQGRALQQLPNGVTRAQMEAALKKCGGGFGAGVRNFNSPAYKASLTKFATCMRENGVNVPEPNTSGNGPIFDTKGLNTSSAQFKNAEAKCRSDLQGTFRRGFGAPPGGPSGGSAAG